MAIATYAELQSAVARWLNRTDLTAVIPDFISLAEAQIKRRLRKKTVRASVVFNAGTYTLPAGCAELRSIRLNTGSPHADLPIQIVTMEVLGERRASSGAVGGRPRYAAVVDRQLVLVPAPDAAYDAEITYFESLTPLSSSVTTNTVLLDAPDLYLYGALKEAEPYMEHDERIPVWTTKFESALTELEIAREREEYNASLRPMRLPVVFG